MSNTTFPDKSFSQLSPEAIEDMRALYFSSSAVLPAVAKMGGEIGRLAELCMEVGVKNE